MLEYYHADRLDYAVVGTPNRLEYDQGFFVKNGDGSADVKPIAHLYKTQVYQLAEELGVPAEIRERAADDRHLRARAEPGGVLLLRPVRQARPLPLRAQRGRLRRGRRRRGRPPDGGRRARLRGHRAQAARGRVPARAAPPRRRARATAGVGSPRRSRGECAPRAVPRVWTPSGGREFPRGSPRALHTPKDGLWSKSSCSRSKGGPFDESFRASHCGTAGRASPLAGRGGAGPRSHRDRGQGEGDLARPRASH